MASPNDKPFWFDGFLQQLNKSFQQHPPSNFDQPQRPQEVLPWEPTEPGDTCAIQCSQAQSVTPPLFLETGGEENAPLAPPRPQSPLPPDAEIANLVRTALNPRPGELLSERLGEVLLSVGAVKPPSREETFSPEEEGVLRAIRSRRTLQINEHAPEGSQFSWSPPPNSKPARPQKLPRSMIRHPRVQSLLPRRSKQSKRTTPPPRHAPRPTQAQKCPPQALKGPPQAQKCPPQTQQYNLQPPQSQQHRHEAQQFPLQTQQTHLQAQQHHSEPHHNLHLDDAHFIALLQAELERQEEEEEDFAWFQQRLRMIDRCGY